MYSANKRMRSMQAGLYKLSDELDNETNLPIFETGTFKKWPTSFFRWKETSLLKWSLMNTHTLDFHLRLEFEMFSVLISVLPNAESRRPLVARNAEENEENPRKLQKYIPCLESYR